MVPPDLELDRRLKDLGAEALRTGTVQVLEHVTSVGGRDRFFRTRLVPESDGEGRPVAVLLVSTDLTDRREVELELPTVPPRIR